MTGGNANAILWVDKYRPKTLDKMDFHSTVNKRLNQLLTSDFPHLLVYGPSGAGKKTRVRALLHELFQSSEKLSLTSKEFQTPSGTKVNISLISSAVHLELNPSDVGNHDRVVVQQLIKEMAQTTTLNTPFKIIIIHEAHLLSKDAQHALRRTMEKYSQNLRIVLISDSVSRILSPIRSRCFAVRVPCPSLNDFKTVFKCVGFEEGLTFDDLFVEKVYKHSKGNMRQAMLILEASAVQNKQIDSSKALILTDWEDFINNQVVPMVMSEQSADRILKVRSKLYELISHCIPPDAILEQMLDGFMSKVKSKEVQEELVKYAALYEHRLKLGQKAIYHLEAFVIRVMAILKESQLKK